MKLALFDLDQTLLDGDTETLWFQYLVKEGHLEVDHLKEHKNFSLDYEQGVLDFSEYVNFILHPLKEFDLETVQSWRELFLQEEIQPRLRFQHLLAEHSEQKHTLVLITATHDFLADPIGRMLKMDLTLSSKPEIVDGRYTGKVTQACFREGKVEMLEENLNLRGDLAEEIWFYTDSQNDLPLLERSDHPIVVEPDDRLREIAQNSGWKIIM